MLGGRSVLIVEDNTIVAMGVENLLRNSGYLVVGLIANVHDALAEIGRTSTIDAAVVDVNLHGEKAFPVMDSLTRAGIPFVIVTGYSRETLPLRFQRLPFVA